MGSPPRNRSHTLGMYVLLNELPLTGIQLPHPKSSFFFRDLQLGSFCSYYSKRLLFAFFLTNGNGLQVTCKVTNSWSCLDGQFFFWWQKPQPDVFERGTGNHILWSWLKLVSRGRCRCRSELDYLIWFPVPRLDTSGCGFSYQKKSWPSRSWCSCL